MILRRKGLREECIPKIGEAVFQLLSGPDSLGRQEFFVYWLNGEDIRGQIFFTNLKDKIEYFRTMYKTIKVVDNWIS